MNKEITYLIVKKFEHDGFFELNKELELCNNLTLRFESLDLNYLAMENGKNPNFKNRMNLVDDTRQIMKIVEGLLC
jgi:hypothetical protein